ncbi:hypothetical protein LVJ85_02090 [Neisseria sp. Dent CA1/247]|uniref:hypothetical protein n=2 Tax=unclassified Neisseria TaxID=2623750 RepID=UPI001FD49D11|nr:hypothetical protein [Neisseria sp. Dent CA1/247]UOO77313.1 hypothetical protein LVJ85_02090 [Neisseria sp. Dent CA1/247]
MWLMLIWFVFFFGVVAIIKQVQRNKKTAFEKERQALIEQHRQQEKERLERIRQRKIEEEKRLHTLKGFMREVHDCHQYAKTTAGDYFKKSQSSRLSIDDRNRMILWESLEICLISDNPKTIQSRSSVMNDILKDMKYPHIPIGDKEIRLVNTRHYMVYIEHLNFKITTYKTDRSKEKARNEIQQVIKDALNDEFIYQGAFKEFLNNQA